MATAYVVVNGRRIDSYRFPDIDYYDHPCLSSVNILMCGGIGISNTAGEWMAGDEPIKAAVLARSKTAGEIGCKDEKIPALLRELDDLGFEIKVRPALTDNESSRVLFGPRTFLGDLFDLGAVCETYRAAGFEVTKIEQRLKNVSRKTPIQALQEYDWANWERPEDGVVTGLCLGYPLWSTIAVI